MMPHYGSRSIAAAALYLAFMAPAQAQQTAATAAPHWTILEEQCWKLSPTAGQCAVNLAGVFASRAQCIAANNGQLEQKGEVQGRLVANRCEMLLEPAR